MVSGSSLDDGEYYEITKYTAPPGLAEGFMVKSTQENIWCRISKTAANSGLRFETLGRRLIECYTLFQQRRILTPSNQLRLPQKQPGRKSDRKSGMNVVLIFCPVRSGDIAANALIKQYVTR
jgi:hypothetical protein